MYICGLATGNEIIYDSIVLDLFGHFHSVFSGLNFRRYLVSGLRFSPRRERGLISRTAAGNPAYFFSFSNLFAVVIDNRNNNNNKVDLNSKINWITNQTRNNNNNNNNNKDFISSISTNLALHLLK